MGDRGSLARWACWSVLRPSSNMGEAGRCGVSLQPYVSMSSLESQLVPTRPSTTATSFDAVDSRWSGRQLIGVNVAQEQPHSRFQLDDWWTGTAHKTREPVTKPSGKDRTFEMRLRGMLDEAAVEGLYRQGEKATPAW
ncbi:hypothetical protein SAMD00023353_2001270 [Rosellinia necatrix]|uniref:Uncharacterized protein n=1 Tax=Rosellinia necatrix TaxID=77044 RepID=A0A1S8A8M9_ROSNE|nr:hypothetical protein SAMD00023353_2001270 [Rosellinia necatrix]